MLDEIWSGIGNIIAHNLSLVGEQPRKVDLPFRTDNSTTLSMTPSWLASAPDVTKCTLQESNNHVKVTRIDETDLV